MLGTLDADDVEAELRTGVVGRSGCLSDGRPYVVPVCYAYRDGCVYGHSMPGAKLTALHRGATVCFEVENITDLSNWRSVIGWGQQNCSRARPPETDWSSFWIGWRRSSGRNSSPLTPLPGRERSSRAPCTGST